MAARNRPAIIPINGEQYYTAQKAQEVLGMSYSGLKYQVLLGNIKSEIPKGRRQSYYRAEDVEQVAKDLQVFSVNRKKKTTSFERVVSREDMNACMEVSKALFGSERGDIEKHMRIVNKNPETYYAVKDEGLVVGYTAIWPVKPDKINDLLAQTIPVRISPDDIETFESGKRLAIYINVIGIKPAFTKEEKRLYGARLIAGLIDVIVNLGERGITLETLAARSNMPEGIRLMQGIGFSEIEPLTPERRTFAIDVKKSGTPFVLRYKEALKNWQAEAQPHQNEAI